MNGNQTRNVACWTWTCFAHTNTSVQCVRACAFSRDSPKDTLLRFQLVQSERILPEQCQTGKQPWNKNIFMMLFGKFLLNTLNLVACVSAARSLFSRSYGQLLLMVEGRSRPRGTLNNWDTKGALCVWGGHICCAPSISLSLFYTDRAPITTAEAPRLAPVSQRPSCAALGRW